MDDIITLLTTEYGHDVYGNEVESIAERTVVFCRVRSVSRSEFYQAAQANLHPDYIFTISHYRDYHGEKALLYTDWTGTEKRYDIIRTYRDGDSLEITAAERVGNEGLNGTA